MQLERILQTRKYIFMMLVKGSFWSTLICKNIISPLFKLYEILSTCLFSHFRELCHFSSVSTVCKASTSLDQNDSPPMVQFVKFMKTNFFYEFSFSFISSEQLATRKTLIITLVPICLIFQRNCKSRSSSKYWKDVPCHFRLFSQEIWIFIKIQSLVKQQIYYLCSGSDLCCHMKNSIQYSTKNDA